MHVQFLMHVLLVVGKCQHFANGNVASKQNFAAINYLVIEITRQRQGHLVGGVRNGCDGLKKACV